MKIVYHASHYRRVGKCSNRWKCVRNSIWNTIKELREDMSNLWYEGISEKIFCVVIVILLFSVIPGVALIAGAWGQDGKDVRRCPHRRYHTFVDICDEMNEELRNHKWQVCDTICKEFFRVEKVS